MKKLLKSVMAVMMSLAMAVCLLATEAGATEVSNHDDEISLNSLIIGRSYSAGDNYGKITIQFTNQSTLLVTYTNLMSKKRYVEMYTSTSSKTFAVIKFTVAKNAAHSESYSINIANASKVTVTVYPHTSSSAGSAYMDPLTVYAH